MLRQIVITFTVGAIVSVLTSFVYTKYFHRCDSERDVGEELHALAARWRQVAASHRREMKDHWGESPADMAAYNEHQAYWLAYESCARRLEALLRRAEVGDVTAEAVGEEQSLPGPVRRGGVGPS
jgi:hypothetical protein